eukprot:1029412-Amphidinium_carterae.1
MNIGLATKVKPTGDDELDKHLWRSTCAEFEKGWLLGPFAFIDQLKRAVCDVPVLNRPFAIRQGDKIRAIDDLSESG